MCFVINGVRPNLLALIIMLGMLISMPGCSGESNDSLLVYSGRSESLVGSIISQFKESTGIDVVVKYGSTTEISATLLEEGGNSPADIYLAQDPAGLEAVIDMLAELPDSISNSVPNWARSHENRWVGISGRARTVVYNTDSVSVSELPTSLLDFTDIKWKNRIGWAPTNASFQAMVTNMRMKWGEDRTKVWLQGIQANNPKVFPKNTPLVSAVGEGEIEIGFANHYYLYRFIQEHGDGFKARNYFLPEGDPGNLVMVAGGGIIKTAKNWENAEQFLLFLLSIKAQRYFADQTFEYPLVENVDAHQTLMPIEDITRPDMNMEDLSDVKGTQVLLRELGIIP